MKIKVSEATKPQLNWLVATIEGKKIWICLPNDPQHVIRADSIHKSYSPTTDPAQAWPIIDREFIDVFHIERASTIWEAEIQVKPMVRARGRGHTSLVAAMRCWVVKNLGDEVEIPEELA